MRCKACDTFLSDREAARRDAETGEYYDLCNPCYYGSKPLRDEELGLEDSEELLEDDDA